eukprot:393457_1
MPRTKPRKFLLMLCSTYIHIIGTVHVYSGDAADGTAGTGNDGDNETSGSGTDSTREKEEKEEAKRQDKKREKGDKEQDKECTKYVFVQQLRFQQQLNDEINRVKTPVDKCELKCIRKWSNN